MAEPVFESEPTITISNSSLASSMDGYYLQPGTPNHMQRKTSESSVLSKKKKRLSILPWKNDHHEGEKAAKVKKSKNADVSGKPQPGMPPPDSIATSTTAASTKGPLADSNPDLDDIEVEKGGGDKIKSSDYKKLTKQIAQLTKTVDALKKDKEGLLEERHSLKGINKVLEREAKQLSSLLDSSKLTKDKRRPQQKQQQQEHTAELEERVRRLELALVERDEEVARLQKKVELQEKMLGQVKTAEEEEARSEGRKPDPEAAGSLERLDEEKEISFRLRGELEALRAEYQALEGKVERSHSDAFFPTEVKPQIKGTPVPRVRSHSISQLIHDSSPTSPSHQHRLSDPSSPLTGEPSRGESRRGHRQGPSYVSPRHVVSHTVVPILPSSPPQSSARPPSSSQADILVLQNCLRLALEEKKASEQKKEQLEEELLYLQAVMETKRADAVVTEKLAQVDHELECTREKLRTVATEKAELEGTLGSLQAELVSTRIRMEGEVARVTAERDAELKAAGEQNAKLRKEIDELRMAVGKVKVSPESQVTITPANSVDGLKVASNGGGAEGRKSPPTCTSDGWKRGAVECQTNPPVSPLSPQSPQRSAANRTADKQKASNKFVHMRAMFEVAKGSGGGEEVSPLPTRRHSVSLVKEKTATEDQGKEEERSAKLPGVHKGCSPEPKATTTAATPPQPAAQLLQAPPTPLSSTLLQNQNTPLVRTVSGSQSASLTKPAAPSAPSHQTPPSPRETTSMQTSSPQPQTIQSTSPTQIIASSHVIPSAQMTTPSAQMTTPSVQMTTPSQAHSALPLQKTLITRMASPAAPPVQKAGAATTLPQSTQGTSPPSQTAPLTHAAPPQTTIAPNAALPNQNGIPSTQSTRAALPPQGSPSRTAPPSSTTSETAASTNVTHDLKGVPLTRVLTPTTRQGEQTTKATGILRDSPPTPLTRLDSKDQPSPASLSRTSPVTPTKTATAIINVQKKDQFPSTSSPPNFSPSTSSSSSEANKPGTQAFTSGLTRTSSASTPGSTDAMPPTPGTASFTTPSLLHRGIVKAERFTVRASSPLYQQGTAELKLALVTDTNGCMQVEGDTPPKATMAAALSTPVSSTLTPVPSTSPTSVATPTYVATPTSISLITTSSVQMRGTHKKMQRPMSYCPQSSTSQSPSSSTNLSSLISRMQVKPGKEEGEGSSRSSALQASSAFMQVASWTSNGVSAVTPTPANRITPENRKDVTQPTNLHAATTQHQSNTHATTSGETKTATSAHAAVYKVVGPPTINKPAGPAVASGPAVAMGPAIAMGPAVAMGPTAVVEKQVVPTAQPETPLQTVPAERLPVKVQRSNTISAFDRNSKKALLLRWCQRMTQDYDNVDIANFAESFANGLAFCALLHHFMPDKIPYHSLNPNEQEKNFKLAFEAASSVGIPALLDVDDMVLLPIPDWMSVMTYVSFIYNKFGKTVQNGTD